MWISSRRGDVPAKALWAEDNAKGHRLGSLQRESIINQLLAAESRLLRCPQVEQSTRTRATLLIFWQRTRKKRTGWRRGGDSNPRDPFESTRVPGVRLKPGSATSPRAKAIMHHARARGQFVNLKISARRSDRPPHTDENAPASESAARIFWRTRPSGGVSPLRRRMGA